MKPTSIRYSIIAQEAWYTLLLTTNYFFHNKNKTIHLHKIQTENTKMMRMSLRIMMVATVNEEGSSCSNLAANFSRLAGLCIHILHQYTAPFKTFTSMHQCSAYVEYKLFCQIKLDYASTFCINTLHNVQIVQFEFLPTKQAS